MPEVPGAWAGAWNRWATGQDLVRVAPGTRIDIFHSECGHLLARCGAAAGHPFSGRTFDESLFMARHSGRRIARFLRWPGHGHAGGRERGVELCSIEDRARPAGGGRGGDEGRQSLGGRRDLGIAGRRQRARLLLEHSGDGVLGAAPDGTIVFLNRAAEELLQIPPGEGKGRMGHELVHRGRPDGTGYPREACPIAAAVAAGEATSSDLDWWSRSDGTFLPVEYRVQPVRRDGEAYGSVVSFRDVRARIAAAYLIDLGAPKSSLGTVSYGEEKPAREGHSEAEWGLNRRVEFAPTL